MKRLFCLLFISLFLVSSISAETFSKDTNVTFQKTCTNNLGATCSSSGLCNISIRYPNSSIMVDNINMTNNNNGIFSVDLTQENITTLGEHNWDMFCCDAGSCDEGHGSFKVTTSGFEVDESNSLIFLISIGFLIVLSIVTFLGFAKLDAKPQAKYSFLIVSSMLFLAALNLISIVINDSLLNNKIASFFDTFTSISFLFYWFGFGLLAILWFITILNTILFKQKLKKEQMFGLP